MHSLRIQTSRMRRSAVSVLLLSAGMVFGAEGWTPGYNSKSVVFLGDGTSRPAAVVEGIAIIVDIPKLQNSAQKGDTIAMMALAEFYTSGSHGLNRDRAEAYKWAQVAQSRGSSSAEYLLKELKLFMSTEEVEKGQEAAELLKQKLEEKSTEIEANDKAGEPNHGPGPPAGTRLNIAGAMRIAKAAAELEGFILSDFKSPKAHYRSGGSWFVFFDSRGSFRSGDDHFAVFVNDRTGEARVAPGM